MSTENSLIDAALRGWKLSVERADKLFGTLSPEQLEQEVAPGKNRLIYLGDILHGVNDRLLAVAGHWRTALPRTRRDVRFETG